MWDRQNGPIYRTKFIASGTDESPYTGSSSHQIVEADLYLDPAAGRDVADTSFLAAVMGNVIGDALTKTGNYLAGMIGAYSITGALAARRGAAGLMGIIMDGVTALDAAVLAVLDGDSGAVTGTAMFGVKSNNSTAASGTDYGLNLQSAAADGFLSTNQFRSEAGNTDFYKKAPVRITNDVCFLTGDGAPVDGTTGLNFAGEGSLYFRFNTGNAAVYINTGTKAATVWKAITHA